MIFAGKWNENIRKWNEMELNSLSGLEAFYAVERLSADFDIDRRLEANLKCRNCVNVPL